MHPILPACMLHSRIMLVHGEVSGKPDQMRTSDLCSSHPFVGFLTANALSLVSLHMLEMFIGHNGKSTDFVKKVAVISKVGVKNNILQAERRKIPWDSMHS